MNRLKTFMLTIVLQMTGALVYGQDCIGGAISTNEAYLYGRFEVAMQSAPGDGVVSSFFLYNVDLDCNWPAENNEIDLEMTGNTENLFFTTHYPGPWYHTDVYEPAFNPHEGIQHYAFEWEPGIVRWFVNGQLVNVQDQAFVNALIHPMRILMNLWAAEASSWVGNWDPAIMPVQSEYEYVKYYAYTPGNGNTGTNNNFTLSWEDHFNDLNTGRWTITDYGGFGGNYCLFKSSNVEINNGRLCLKLTEPILNAPTVPVTFSVNLNQQNLQPTDKINLNGSFNNWCGTCAPMAENSGIWSLTVNLPPGRHEFLYTKNFWQENGNAPIGSECDILPCDEWANYGVVISEGDSAKVLLTVCWQSCNNCYFACMDTLILQNQPIGAGIYAADRILISESELEAGAEVDMHAQEVVRLKSGFSVSAGNHFKAYIAACDSTLIVE